MDRTKAQTGSGGFQEILERRVGSIERRRGRRGSLGLSCHVSPVSTVGVEFAGTVVDISRSGILVGFDSAPIRPPLKPGDVARVLVDLPRHPLFSPRCLECIARAVRIVPVKYQIQVVFEIGRMRIKDQNTRKISRLDWLSAPVEGLIQ